MEVVARDGVEDVGVVESPHIGACRLVGGAGGAGDLVGRRPVADVVGQEGAYRAQQVLAGKPPLGGVTLARHDVPYDDGVHQGRHVRPVLGLCGC